MRAILFLLVALTSTNLSEEVSSFAPQRIYARERVTTFLSAAKQGKKRRRRRKQPPGGGAGATDAAAIQQPPPVATEKETAIDPTILSMEEEPQELSADDLMDIAEVAKFEFKPPSDDTATGIESSQQSSTDADAVPLPDIREAKQKKQLKEDLARQEEEEELSRVKVKRSDKEAFAKLLEQSPYSDADDSLFEEEAYGTVSALLGERAEKFLGIPTGPLQVGHFVGALGIMLMAFIEYPGFPLTNLPTPLRECLQGGLGTVYAINLVLAILAFFKAGERAQPRLLWVAKTFSVGGLAYDQLTQVPTSEELAQAQAKKGARSLDNLRKKR